MSKEHYQNRSAECLRSRRILQTCHRVHPANPFGNSIFDCYDVDCYEKKGRSMKTLLAFMAIVAVAATALVLAATSQRAEANQAMSQKTGKGCPTCHTAPPALNGTGKKYKETGKL
jgi:hypothetical protein